MAQSKDEPTDNTENAECANCGHAKQFHADDQTRGAQATADSGACMSPEDGTPCFCAGFKAL
jgi:hypothetical protein